MESSSDTPITFMIYSIPNHADPAVLQMLFQQKVERYVYFGSGSTRFVLVELNDETFARQLAEAVEHHRLVHDPRRTPGEEAESEEAPSTEETGKEVHPPAHRAVAYLQRVKWGTEPIHIVRSPVRIDDLYRTGGVVRDHEPEDEFQKKKSEMYAKGKEERRGANASFKRPREEGSGADGQVAAPANMFPKNCCQKCGSADHFTRNCDGSGPGPEAAAPAAPPQEAPEVASGSEVLLHKKSYPKDCCQKCGSKDHFTRNCDGSGSAPQEAASAPSAPAPTTTTTSSDPAPAPAAVPAKQSYPKDSCQKCGSKDHSTRNCDGGHTAAPSQPAKEVGVKAAPPAPPVQAAAPVFARTSKDQCKHCGSEEHLSRHCPTK